MRREICNVEADGGADIRILVAMHVLFGGLDQGVSDMEG